MTLTLFHLIVFISCIVGYGAVIVIDTAGLFWILKKRSLDFVYSLTGVTQPLIWIGWTGIVIGLLGSLSISSLTPTLSYQFILLTILGLNGIYLHTIKSKLNPSDQHQNPPVFHIFLATLISQVSWVTFLYLQFIRMLV